MYNPQESAQRNTKEMIGLRTAIMTGGKILGSFYSMITINDTMIIKISNLVNYQSNQKSCITDIFLCYKQVKSVGPSIQASTAMVIAEP